MKLRPPSYTRTNTLFPDPTLFRSCFRDHSASRQVTGQAVLKGGFGDGGRYSVLLNTHDLRADDPQGLTAAQLRVDRRAASAGALNFDTRKTVHQDQAGVRLARSEEHTSELQSLMRISYAFFCL